MTTSNTTAAIARIETAAQQSAFKNGNVRSLANLLVKTLGNEAAWTLARAVKAAAPEFTAADVLALLAPTVAQVVVEAPAAKVDHKVKAAQAAHASRASKKTTSLPYGELQAGETKSDRIRARFAEGAGVAAIAKELGLTVRRVKNVRKTDQRKQQALDLQISQREVAKRAKAAWEASQQA